jgi:tetratricopeptide (TPR) repeat protein
MKPLLLPVLLFSFLSLDAQSTEKVLATADSLLLVSEYESALKNVEAALLKTTDPNSKAQLINKKSEIFIGQGKLADGEREIQNLSTHNWTTVVQQGAYRTNVGYLELLRGRYDLAADELQKAYLLFEGAGAEKTKEAARCLSLQSLTYSASGRYNQAESSGLIALQLREQLFGTDHEAVAAAYNDLGVVYSQIDKDRALEYYEKALAVYQKLHGMDHPKIAIGSTNIGSLYRELELYGDAINNLETAAKIWKKIYPDGHHNEAFVFRILGQTYFNMGDHKTALIYFEKALSQYRKSFGEKNPDIASTLNQIATIQLAEAKYDDALSHIQQALCANIPNFSNTDFTVNPPTTSFYNANVLLYSLRLKSQALEERHFGKTLKFSDLKFALSTLYLCDSLIDDIRHHSVDESDKISLGAIASEVYEDGVRISYTMSEMSAKPRIYQEQAFYFAEKSKSAVLQESIADSQAKSFAGIPSDLVEEEENLKATIAFLSQKLSQKPDTEEEKYLRESLFTLNREYQAFITKLETEYPDYYNLKFNTSSPTVAELQKLVSPDEAIVSYFIADVSNRIYHFVITQKKFKSYYITLPPDFDRYSRGFKNGIYFREFQTYFQSAQSLREVLMPRVPSHVNDLVLVPSGRLGTIPFEALPLSKKTCAGFSDVDYLVNKYSVGYEFSTGLISQKNRHLKKVSNTSILLCAPVKFPVEDNLADLPGSESEVNAIALLFPKGETKVVLQKEANESMVKSDQLASYNYLHFATHGIVDETEPELSRIFLNGHEGEDGKLFAGEIYNLNLNADLAVLSACQTGLGKVSKGEGVIGLSRALVYAGARNLMVSFWSVSDESTALLMTDFYRGLLSPPAKNYRSALQLSKKKMIADKKYAEPYYWAPFVVIGF